MRVDKWWSGETKGGETRTKQKRWKDIGRELGELEVERRGKKRWGEKRGGDTRAVETRRGRSRIKMRQRRMVEALVDRTTEGHQSEIMTKHNTARWREKRKRRSCSPDICLGCFFMELPSTAFSKALDKTPTSSRSALSHVIFSISEQRKSARSIKIGSRDVSLHALSNWWTRGQTCKGLQLGRDRTSSIHYAFTLKDSTSSYRDAVCVSSGEVQ